ncbi:DUF1667 domain-containing protein [Acholeplasma vituli]|uniref:DUF1667 domain-containing protein n=1 Tax=Paracholeplasma vituli TaxID=69473 RepID=A0ABT2PX24_9MOLU|nr:DUF1667 domain-containing protein [Paracholeplasma vituli]MCU0105504.1 DUF1667 domain-containing protein [Paracholeplasma vituli]
MKELTCIICPVSCHLSIDDAKHVVGNRCPRGEKYAIVEVTAPTRMVTTTVKTKFENCPRLSVKTQSPIPKALIFPILALLDEIVITNHVKIGDVVVHNIANTGIDVVATKSIQ